VSDVGYYVTKNFVIYAGRRVESRSLRLTGYVTKMGIQVVFTEVW